MTDKDERDQGEMEAHAAIEASIQNASPTLIWIFLLFQDLYNCNTDSPLLRGAWSSVKVWIWRIFLFCILAVVAIVVGKLFLTLVGSVVGIVLSSTGDALGFIAGNTRSYHYSSDPIPHADCPPEHTIPKDWGSAIIAGAESTISTPPSAIIAGRSNFIPSSSSAFIGGGTNNIITRSDDN